jgi:hypothetical protein
MCDQVQDRRGGYQGRKSGNEQGRAGRKGRYCQRRAYLRGYLIAVPAVALTFAIMLFLYAMALKRHGLI